MSELSNSTENNSIIPWLWKRIKRIPFTLCMVVILLVVAWVTHSYFQELARIWINRLGFAPRDFWLFRWERLFLSALVTAGGITFWLALVMVAITSGVSEWKTGSFRAVVAFWGVHLVTLIMESALFLLPLHQLGFPQARAVFFSRDVGPSAGYMGSLGYVIALLPKPWRWLVFWAIMIFLVVSFFITPPPGQTLAIKLADDMAHLIAFPLGWLTAKLIGRRSAA